MDFILKQFEFLIERADKNSVGRRSLLQARVEYLFYFLLGYFWNEKSSTAPPELLVDLMKTLQGKLTMGSIPAFLKRLDDGKVVFSSKKDKDFKAFMSYVEYRNSQIGHGYVFDDFSDQDEEQLETAYTTLIEQIELFKENRDYIVVRGISEDGKNYSGDIYLADGGQYGWPSAWKISKQQLIVDESLGFPQLICRTSEEHHKISPFIWVDDTACPAECYVFNSIKQIQTGKTEYTRLFRTGKFCREVPEFKNYEINKDGGIVSPNNSTVMNKYEPNYSSYYDMGFVKNVKEALKSRAHVTTVVSGNGGVGKTACVQKLCNDVFSADKQEYEYIVFASAKDRRFNYVTGDIENVEEHVHGFYDIISIVYNTMFGKEIGCNEDDIEFEKRCEEIGAFEGEEGKKALLLVIDDFETFSDGEKEKIKSFIDHMLVEGQHRVIITTRNVRLTSGYQVSMDKLEEKQLVAFITDTIKEKAPESLREFEQIIADRNKVERIINCTSGVPIFALQWVNLFMQKKMGSLFSEKLSEKDKAQDFLMGRIYESLNETTKIMYSVIPYIASQESGVFNLERLRFVCSKYISRDDFDAGIDELVEQYVVEVYESDKTTASGDVYRVYNDFIYADMQNKYETLSDEQRDYISSRFRMSGSTTSGVQSPFLGIIKQAGQSTVTEEKERLYRGILKMNDCPDSYKKQAITEWIKFWILQMHNVDRARDVFKTLDEKYRKDADIRYKYLYYLWASDKKAAFELIEEELTVPVSFCEERMRLQMLCLGYYLIYVMDMSYEFQEARFFEIDSVCSSLMEYLQRESDKGCEVSNKRYKHELKGAIVQIVKTYSKRNSDQNKATAKEFAEFFLNQYTGMDSVMEQNAIKNLCDVLPSPNVYASDDSNTAGDSTGSEEMLFVARDIHRDINGAIKFLNGRIGNTLCGIPKSDFERYGFALNRFDGVENIMNSLIKNAALIPVTIVRVSEKGYYTASVFDQNNNLDELMKRVTEKETITAKRSNVESIPTGTIVDLFVEDNKANIVSGRFGFEGITRPGYINKKFFSRELPDNAAIKCVVVDWKAPMASYELQPLIKNNYFDIIEPSSQIPFVQCGTSVRFVMQAIRKVGTPVVWGLVNGIKATMKVELLQNKGYSMEEIQEMAARNEVITAKMKEINLQENGYILYLE